MRQNRTAQAALVLIVLSIVQSPSRLYGQQADRTPASGQEILSLSFDQPIAGAAVDGARGRVGVVCQGETVLHIRSTRLPSIEQDVPLGAPPVSVAWKRLDDKDFFAILTSSPASLILVDGESLQITRKVALDLKKPWRVVPVPDRNSPLLFLMDSDSFLLPLTQFNLRELRPTGTMTIEPQFGVSHDGSTLYRNVSQGSEYGVVAFPAESQNRTPIERLPRVKRPWSPLLVAHDPPAIAIGSRLYSMDLKDELLKCEFIPRAFLNGTALMAGLESNRVFIGSRSNGRIIDRVSLPRDWMPPPEVNPRPPQQQQEPQVLADIVNQQFLVVLPRRIAMIRATSSGSRAPDALVEVMNLPTELTVGREFRQAIEVAGGGANVSLVSPPSGLDLQKNELRWKPGLAQTGAHEITLRLTAGESAREQKWRVRVSSPHLNLPFSPTGVRVTKDGRQALIWGTSDPKKRLQDDRQLAVVDLSTQTITTSKTISAHIVSADLSGEHVCILVPGTVTDPRTGEPRMVRKLQRLDRKFEQGAEAICGPQAADVRITADRIVYVRTDEGSGHLQRLSLPDLTDSSVTLSDGLGRAGYLEGRVSQGWLLNGVLWDEAVQTPQLLVWPYQIRQYPPGGVPLSGPAGKLKLSAGGWSPFLPPPPKGDAGIDFQNGWRGEVAVSPDVPAVMRFIGHGLRAPFAGAVNVEMALTDLQQDRLLKRFVIGTVRPEELHQGSLPRCRIATSPEVSVVLIENQVVVVPTSELVEGLPRPFGFELRQSQFLLAADAPNRVRYAAPGATRFTLDFAHDLRDSRPGKLTSTNGEFVIELKDHLPSAIDRWVGIIANIDGGREASNPDRIVNFRLRSGPEANRLLNPPPTGLLIPLRVVVSAENDAFETAFLIHDYLVEIPEADVLSRLNAKYPPSK